MKQEKKIPEGIQIRQVKYLNNIVEQDHRFIKKRVRSMLGFKSFRQQPHSYGDRSDAYDQKRQHVTGQSVQNEENSSIDCSAIAHPRGCLKVDLQLFLFVWVIAPEPDLLINSTILL